MFLDNMLTAAEQVIILYVIVAVGFVADKCGVFTEKVARSCTDLLFYVITPAKIIQSFLTLEYNPETAKGLFVAIGCGLLLHGVAAIISTLCFNKSGAENGCIYKFACAYGNCGYMALPLANAVLGEEGVFYCSAVIISFQMFCFTHGIYAMNWGKQQGKAKVDLKRLVLNPGVISVIIGLPLFLLSVDLPGVIRTPVDYIASLNTPFAMLIFGTYIANTKFSSMLRQWRILGVASLKLVILPLLMLGIFSLFGIRGTLLTALVMSASSPPANNTVMFAAKYDRNIGLASQTVTAVSFLSVITMPLMIGLAASVK